MTTDNIRDDALDDAQDETQDDEPHGAALPAWDPGDPRAEDALREAEIREIQLVYNSSNYVFMARLAHPELGEGTGVYKPRRGEQPLRDFPDGLYEREIAAFELSRLLGWGLVPTTVERAGPHGVGSMQLFIPHDPREHYFVLREHDDLDEQLVRVAVFDLLANNADRKAGHLLLDVGGHVWGIDNGLCFHAQRKLRTVIWDYAGTELPRAWVADIARVHALLAADDDTSAGALRTRIAAREVAALLRRCEALLEHPVLPEMYTDYRCVPWPMI
ncbi:MAG: phosphatidylinositol kinase [Dehalococcoidia bacterium]